MNILPSQIEICARFGVDPMPAPEHERLGIAIETLALQPINGVRVPPYSDVSGWFVFGGKQSMKDDFYSPLCLSHLEEYCPIVIPYLCLPAGWAFQIDSAGYEDVWFDESLLKPV